MSFLSIVLYLPLQIVFIPLAVMGALLVAYRQLVVSKKLGISQTAIEVLNGRWTMHVFGIRADEATARLAKELPNTSLIGLWLALFPLWLKHRISGKHFLYPRVPEPGAETLRDLIVARTLYFDRIIERVIGKVEQFVLLGAGYDMRAYGNLQNKGLAIFETDQARVQQHKKDALAGAGIPCEHVRFVPVDFSKGNPFDKLRESGFDRTKKTLFLWEGVTLYLTESDVRKTMQEVRDNAPEGSLLIADFYADYFVRLGKLPGVRKSLDYTNEGFGFSLPFSTDFEKTLLEFAGSGSMAVAESHFLGSTSAKGPFAVVVEMKC